MNLIKSSLKLSSSQGIVSIFTFIALAFFARELGAEALGIYFLFQSVKGAIKLISNLGIRSAIEKQISEQKYQDEIFATGVLLRVFLMLPFLFGINIFRGRISQFIGADVALLLIVAIIIDEMSALLVNVLKGELRVGETAELQVIHQVSWAVFGIILVLVGFEVIGLIYASIIGSLLKTVWGLHKISVSFGMISYRRAKMIISEGKFYFLPNMDSYLYNWLDVLIIGFFLSQAEVGAYEVAWRVSVIIAIFSKALANSLFPQVSMWDASMSYNRIMSVLPKALTASYLLVIPGFFGILALSKEILSIVFAPEFVHVWPVLVILAAGKIIDATRAIVGPTLRGIGRADLSTLAVGISGISNLILNVIFVWKYGLIGAAVATVLATFLRTGVQYYYLQEYHPIVFPSGEFVWLVFSASMMAGLVVFLKQHLLIDSILPLIFVISSGIVIYFGFVLLSPSLRQSILDNLNNIIRV